MLSHEQKVQGKASALLSECAVYTMRDRMIVGIMAAFCSTGARQHAETSHGIGLGLIIVRVAPFCWPLGAFHKKLSSMPRHRVGKVKRSVASLNLPEACFTCEPFGSPLILLTVEKPRCPLAGGSLDL